MLSLIVAIAENEAIGNDNKLLCYLPDDLKYFKEVTMKKTIIMGRKTFESLPGILPNRHHVVISRNKNFIQYKNIEIKDDLENTLKYYAILDKEVFVIGGTEIYNQALKFCDKLYITRIFKNFKADSFLKINYDNYKLEWESEVINNNDIDFKFQTYLNLHKE